MKLAHTADEIAGRIWKSAPDMPPDWEHVREMCDTATGSELCPSLLDRLADMVARRLETARGYGTANRTTTA